MPAGGMLSGAPPAPTCPTCACAAYTCGGPPGAPAAVNIARCDGDESDNDSPGGSADAYDKPLPQKVRAGLTSALGARREAMARAQGDVTQVQRSRRAKQKQATLRRKGSRMAKWKEQGRAVH